MAISSVIPSQTDWQIVGPIYQELFNTVADWGTSSAHDSMAFRRQNSALLRGLCWLMNDPDNPAAKAHARKLIRAINIEHGGTR